MQVWVLQTRPLAQPPQSAAQMHDLVLGSQTWGDTQVAPHASPLALVELSFQYLYETATFTPAALGMQLP